MKRKGEGGADIETVYRGHCVAFLKKGRNKEKMKQLSIKPFKQGIFYKHTYIHIMYVNIICKWIEIKQNS